MLDGAEVAADLERSLHSVSDKIPDADDLHADLASKYNVHICAGSAPVYDEALSPRPVNRARLFSPTGGRGFQDKQIMTRYERTPMDMAACAPLKLFDTSLGKIGILICYDSEFPLLGRGVDPRQIYSWCPPAPRRFQAIGACASARWPARWKTNASR